MMMRNLAMELVRVTESAALAAARWVGRGNKLSADGAAVDAMRNVLDTVNMDGIVVIGEGEKDEAPMLYNGERVGNGASPMADVAVDPIDGTTLTALGRGNALAVIAVAERDSMFNPGPCVYMEKIAVGAEAASAIDLNATPTKNLKEVAKAMKKTLHELTVMILERERHDDLIAEVRVGCANPFDQRRRHIRRNRRGFAGSWRGHLDGHWRNTRGCHSGSCPQGHGWRNSWTLVPAQRCGTRRGDCSRL